jgi:hypothetical protein
VLEYNLPKLRQLCTTDIVKYSVFLTHSHSKPLLDKGTPAKDWHKMIGHLYCTTLEKLLEITTSCKLTNKEYNLVCKGCKLKNTTQIISRRLRLRATTLYETIHLDLIQMKLGVNNKTQILYRLCDLVQQNMVYTLLGKHQDTLVQTI